MPDTTYRILMNGVTGRMGYRQHLLRSILAIRDDGGIALPDGTRLQVEPVLVGRNADKLARLADAARHRRLDDRPRRRAAEDPAPIYFDAQVTSERKKAILKAAAAGKHVYTEKPIAESVDEGQELVDAAERHGIINGVVHDKLYLPGLMKLKRLVDSGFFGRILSVRGEFGYWVFEGDYLPAQRPSWNYRAEDGGGMVLDMFCHWNYVLENLFGRGRGGHRQGGHPHPRALGRAGRALRRHGRRRGVRHLRARRAASSPRSTRRGRCGSTARSSSSSRSTAPTAPRSPGCSAAASSRASATPKPVWNPDLPTDRGLPRPVAARCPTTRSSATASGRSGSSSCSTSTPDGRTATTSPPACAGSQLVDAGPAVVAPRAGGSTLR